MALQNIQIVAQEMQGDNGPKTVVTIWADNVDWDQVTIEDDAALGLMVMDAVLIAQGDG